MEHSVFVLECILFLASFSVGKRLCYGWVRGGKAQQVLYYVTKEVYEIICR